MYKKNGKVWEGFCDLCEMPMQPAYIETKIKHKKKGYSFGFCVSCKKKAKELMGAFRNLYYLYVLMKKVKSEYKGYSVVKRRMADKLITARFVSIAATMANLSVEYGTEYVTTSIDKFRRGCNI